MTEKTYKYSEIFYSFQGEGKYTGIPTAWIRFFLCNLQCNGFGQKDPTDPSTYELPYQTIDITDITRIEDLPVFEYGCDSSYSWSKRYRHLAHDDTAEVIADKLEDLMEHESNPLGNFIHPLTRQDTHLALTGGEPMLKKSQEAIVDILTVLQGRSNLPHNVTVETNGTQYPTAELEEFITRVFLAPPRGKTEWFWSVSPKLWTTAGEKNSKAIKPEVVGHYNRIGGRGQLKYVVNGTKESWEEVEEHTARFREQGVYWPVYIMPVGATKEEQELDIIPEIAVEAMKRGYYFSGRLHAYVFGNTIGT